MSTKRVMPKSAGTTDRHDRAPKKAPAPMSELKRVQVLEEGVRRLQHARSQCMMMLPGCAAALLQYPSFAVLDERVPTACTNGVAMYFNPLFLLQLSDEECAFLYAHEVWHNLLLHSFRAAGREARRWNIACDLEVNHILMTHGMTPVAGGWFVKPPVHRAAERWYEEVQKPYGELWRALRDRAPVDRRRGGHIWDTAEPDAPGEDSQDDDVDVPTRTGSRREPTWLRDIQGLRDPNVMLEPDPEAVSTATTLAECLESSMSKLVTQSWTEGEAGDMPILPWEQLLQEFLEPTRSGRADWNRPSRRHIHRGLYLPSVRGQRLTACIAVDVSGSMWESLREVVTLVRQVLSRFDAYDVRLIACDQAIEADVMLSEYDPLPESWEVNGGGGTDFRPVFNALQDSGPDVLLFVTDGMGVFPDEPPDCPVLWLLTQPTPVPFGRALQVPVMVR
jgi:predicted metal-dependent peptidase